MQPTSPLNSEKNNDPQILHHRVPPSPHVVPKDATVHESSGIIILAPHPPINIVEETTWPMGFKLFLLGWMSVLILDINVHTNMYYLILHIFIIARFP
jgi:hypothetical protein